MIQTTDERTDVTETQTESTSEGTKLDFRCEVCGRTFQSQQGLIIHKGRAHNGAGSDADNAKLLKLLFPAGMVPYAKLDRINAWLDEAKQLKSGK